MNKQLISEFIDAIASDNDEVILETSKNLTLNKVKEKMGYATEDTLTEVGQVEIKHNDVFVSGKKVGEVNLDSDDSSVQFTDIDGKSQTFEDTESLYRYLNGLNESDNRQSRLRNAVKNLPDNRGDRMSKAADRMVVKSSDGDGEEGDYKKHDPRGALHKDDRMENPKKHDHGHDDPSHAKEVKEGSKGSNPEDKKHSLKDKLHKDDRMENPKGHDHGHDDKSGVVPSTHGASSGNNPPDKTHELKNSKHKDDRMENPKKHDHGHNDPTATGTGKNK